MPLVGICLATFGLCAVRALGAPSLPDFQKGNLRVEFSDRHGVPMALPYFELTSAHPKMLPVTATVTVHNVGSLPATYTLSVADLQASQRSLADALVLRVKAPSGSVLYEGGLTGMSFPGSGALGAGGLASYSIETSWPDHGVEDYWYEGQTLSFSLQLTSEVAAVSP